MIFRAISNDDGTFVAAVTDQFDVEMTWGTHQLADEPYLKATSKRVTVTTLGYVAIYDIVSQTETEVSAVLRSVRSAT